MSETKMITVLGRPMPVIQCEPKLPLELKARWLEALRSGKYKQTQKILKCDDAYCCLGVLSSIQGRLVDVDCNATDGVDSNGGALCLATDNPVKFVDSYLIVRFGDTSFGLATLNDLGATFEELANVIEYAF